MNGKHLKILEMENKYYKPDISEFHDGFEYEYLSKDGWSCDTIMSYPDFEEIFCDMVVRVKYLDKADIESCGFEVNWGFGYTLNGRYSMYYIHKAQPHYQDDTCKATIIDHYADGKDSDFRLNKLFDGTINNLSELKKLLKQLNIK